MKQFDTIIRGGTVVTAGDTIQCDVGIKGEKIIALGSNLEDDSAKVIDATGLLVMPGGIDSHVHIDQARAQELLWRMTLIPAHYLPYAVVIQRSCHLLFRKKASRFAKL